MKTAWRGTLTRHHGACPRLSGGGSRDESHTTAQGLKLGQLARENDVKHLRELLAERPYVAPL